MRRFSFSMLLAAICLLPVGIGIGSGMSARSHAMAALDGALANKASEEAQVLADYFSRGQSIDLLTANNPAFQQFYKLSGDLRGKVRSGGPVVDEVNQALAYLERLFPDSIGEACFIDPSVGTPTTGMWLLPRAVRSGPYTASGCGRSPSWSSRSPCWCSRPSPSRPNAASWSPSR
jgi:hypothetical protein